ncbi:hypothetical protein [Aminobacter sp. LjRoot7]|uniref:hypothetical protein n=1 Tax=Aminobacter sp. LjRoot7 TaxID=3342335 RepID=UPI003ED10596
MPTIARELDKTAAQALQPRREEAAPRRVASFGDTLLTVALVLYPALAAVGAIAAGLMFSA